jgi:alkanesulfonate monooxygenase SsuD/methylene tetrahydromethanopterin reductase-like flavin-dependent oxidoreductase (luciferase family)
VKLGVAFGWHVHRWETLLSLVRRAEELGFAAAFVDGDISILDSDRKFDVLNGWTATTALLGQTEHIGIGSIRLVHHWNAAQLAQAVATVERLHPGRLRFLISIGDRPGDERFGFPKLSQRDRIVWLDEMLTAVRGLWRGEAVTLSGRHVRLDGATVQPSPPGGRIPIAIAARGPRMLDMVASHADIWDVNLPPLPDRVGEAAQHLEDACRQRGRDPAEIGRSMWIFTRTGQSADLPAAMSSFRRLNPWFHWIPDAEIAESLVLGSGDECWAKIATFARDLQLSLPIIDLSGLDAAESHRCLEQLSPKNFVDAGTSTS